METTALNGAESMTRAEYEFANPGTNSRFLAWCADTGRPTHLKVGVDRDGHKYMAWIEKCKREAGPGDGVSYGRIVDHAAFTEYLWRVAGTELH